MATESQAKRMLSGAGPKQRIMGGVLVIVLLITGWQVMALFGSDGSAPPASIPTAATNGVHPPASGSGTPTTAAQSDTDLRQVPVPLDTSFFKLQKETEQKYVNTLTELESLKLQREIAETNEAIATAKLATVQAEKSITDLLTRPAPAPVPVADYANRLVAPIQSGESVVSRPPGEMPSPSFSGGPSPIRPALPTTPTPLPDLPYSVISVSMQLDKWMAVIGFQGKLYSVAIGDTLPADGSIVTSINNEGVILKKEGKARKISLVQAI